MTLAAHIVLKQLGGVYDTKRFILLSHLRYRYSINPNQTLKIAEENIPTLPLRTVVWIASF